MAENKNQSWPSVTGRTRTGSGFDINNINPRQRLDNLRKQKFQGEMALTSQYAAIMQNLGARSIANQEQLAMTRQTNLQRMAGLYGNYFQEFGGVLNEGALEFLDKHSKINVPTLTAIMAGYEHARASAADRELMALQKQEQLLKEGLAIEQERAALADKRAANDALALTTNLEQAAKSYSDYMSGVIADAGGAGATGRRGAGGVAGAGGAASFQAPVTGGGGTGAVTDAAATGVFNPRDEKFVALQQQIANSKAAQTAGQGVQYGPLTQREIDIDKQITTFGDFGNTRNLAITGIAAPIVGGALTSYGSRAQLGYLDRQGKAFYDIANSDYMNFKNQTDVARLNLEAEEANIRRLARNDPRFSRHTNMERYLRGIERRNELRMDYMRRGIPIPRGLQDSPVEAQIRNRLLNANNLRSSLASATITERQGLQARNLIADQFLGGQSKIDMANKATAFQRGRGLIARGAGKLTSKLLGPVSWALTTLDLADEVYGGGAAIGRWLRNTGEDLLGVTTERLRQDPNYLENRITPGQEYDRRRNAFLAGENIVINRISGGRWNIGLENDIANMTIKRMRELGYEPNANEITQISINAGNNEQDSANALEALLRAQGDGSGNLAGTNDSIIKFYNDVLAESAYARTYATQANKAAQNQQITNQQAAEEAEKANMIDPRTHRFLAAMMKHYTDMGRQAGYDFHEGHAIQFANVLQQIIADMESGNKQGAVGANTSTGPATSRYQMKKGTFQSAVKWMLDEDEKAGNQLLNPNEREILREARSKDANFLDNDQYKHLLGMMVLLYPLKSSVSASKFGKGNPDIRGDQMIVDMIQQFKNGGNKLTPYLLSNIGVWHGGAGWGRTGEKEFSNIQNRYTALIQSNFGPDHVATGVYMPDAQIGEFLGNQGIQWDMRYDPTIWRNQWVAENFDKNEKGDDLVPKSTYKPYEQWKIDNGLNQVRQVGESTPVKEYNLGNLMTGQTVPGEANKYFYYENFPNFRGYAYANIEGLIPEFANRLGNFSNWYKENIGEEFYGSSGHRTKKDQEKVKASAGNSAAEPGYSYHGSGAAFDADWKRALSATRKAIKNNPDLLKKYGATDAADLLDKGLAQSGLTRNLKHRADEQHHIQATEDDAWRAAVNTELLDEHRKTGMLGTQPGSYYMRKNQSSGWTLPSVASLPFAPVEYPQVMVEEQAPSQIQYPQGLDFLGQYIDPRMVIQQPAYPQTNWQEGMNQLNQQPQQEEGNYGTVYIGSQQMQTFLGWDEQGNPVYQ